MKTWRVRMRVTASSVPQPKLNILRPLHSPLCHSPHPVKDMNHSQAGAAAAGCWVSRSPWTQDLRPGAKAERLPSVHQTARAEGTNGFSDAPSHSPLSDLPKSEHWSHLGRLSLPPFSTSGQSWSPPTLIPPQVSQACLPCTPWLLCPPHPEPPALHSCSRPPAAPTLPSNLSLQSQRCFKEADLITFSSQLKITAPHNLQRKCSWAWSTWPSTHSPCLLALSSDPQLLEYVLFPLLCPTYSCSSFKTNSNVFCPSRLPCPFCLHIRGDCPLPVSYDHSFTLTPAEALWNSIATADLVVCLHQETAKLWGGGLCARPWAINGFTTKGDIEGHMSKVMAFCPHETDSPGRGPDPGRFNCAKP